MENWLNNGYPHMMKYYAAIKKESFGGTWVAQSGQDLKTLGSGSLLTGMSASPFPSAPSHLSVHSLLLFLSNK